MDLEKLPKEILYEIFSYISSLEFLNSHIFVCKDFYEINLDEKFWRYLCLLRCGRKLITNMSVPNEIDNVFKDMKQVVFIQLEWRNIKENERKYLKITEGKRAFERVESKYGNPGFQTTRCIRMYCPIYIKIVKHERWMTIGVAEKGMEYTIGNSLLGNKCNLIIGFGIYINHSKKIERQGIHSRCVRNFDSNVHLKCGDIVKMILNQDCDKRYFIRYVALIKDPYYGIPPKYCEKFVGDFYFDQFEKNYNVYAKTVREKKREKYRKGLFEKLWIKRKKEGKSGITVTDYSFNNNANRKPYNFQDKYKVKHLEEELYPTIQLGYKSKVEIVRKPSNTYTYYV